MSTAEGVLEQQRSETKSNGRRLSNRLQQQLGRPGYPALTDVRIEEHGGHVVIRGRVRSYYQKQLAQSIAMQNDGVDTITNELEVG